MKWREFLIGTRMASGKTEAEATEDLKYSCLAIPGLQSMLNKDVVIPPGCPYTPEELMPLISKELTELEASLTPEQKHARYEELEKKLDTLRSQQ